MEKEEISKLIRQTNDTNKWIPKKIFLQINENQYNALLKGYKISWEMRYSLHYADGYFYNHRSGWMVGKFKIERIEENLYQVTEMYANREKYDCWVIFESLREACLQNRVALDLEQHIQMCKKTSEMQDIE